MLKIKDNVDLRELEKFGYIYESMLDIYYKVIIPQKKIILIFDITPKARTITITKEREIITREMTYWLDWNKCITNKKDIKDLIKANLVEKVGDKNE